MLPILGILKQYNDKHFIFTVATVLLLSKSSVGKTVVLENTMQWSPLISPQEEYPSLQSLSGLR